METVLIKTLQLLCCLSLLVVLHEGGHFGFAKLFGVKVEKFFMFFDWKFHLFSTMSKWFTRLFPHFKDNETEYGIGWIPLGGYVKIAGMIDESMDTEQMKKPAQPNEFRSKPVWQRFFIMFGGVLMNLITAWVIYSLVLLAWGRDYTPITSLEDGFQYNEQAHSLGFQDGDIPIRADQKDIVEYSTAVMRTIANASTVTVLREGKEIELEMPGEGLSMIKMIQAQPPFLMPMAEAFIDSVVPGSPAQRAGIVPGMKLLSAGGKNIKTWADYDNEVTLRRQDVLSSPDCTAEDSLRWRSLTIVVATADLSRQDTIALQLDKDYMMGVTRKLPKFKTVHLDYSLASCLPAGLSYGWRVLKNYVSDLRYVASADGAKSVGSFITIGNIFPSAWDWQQFWMLTALISIILAVMNILPIPGLDGGHIVLLFYEGITGHQPSDKAMEWIEKIGIGIILALMILAMSNDIRNFILPLFGL